MAAEDYIDFEDYYPPGYENHAYSITNIKRETDKAWCIILGWPEDKEYWLPKSKCKLSYDKQTIHVPGWLSKAKGMKPHYGGDY